MKVHTQATVGLGLMFGLLAACGGSDGGQANSDQPLGNSVKEPPASAPRIAKVGSAETGLGTVLVNGGGLTLYILTEDSVNTPSCYDECIESWRPLLAEGDPEAGPGIDASKLAVATRNDGTFQVTYFGRPLYLFTEDTSPGDTLGHGKGSWLVLSPSGELLEEPLDADSYDEEYNPDDYY